MFDGMTDKHINFDLSKTDNVAADVGTYNERNILCKFCNAVILWQGTCLKSTHHVSEKAQMWANLIDRFKCYLIKNNLREFEP